MMPTEPSNALGWTADATQTVMRLNPAPIAGDFLRRRGSNDWYRINHVVDDYAGRTLASVKPYVVADTRRALPPDSYHYLDETFEPGCLKASDQAVLDVLAS